MTSREYLEDEDAEEPDDFIISLTSKVHRSLPPPYYAIDNYSMCNWHHFSANLKCPTNKQHQIYKYRDYCILSRGHYNSCNAYANIF